MLGRSSPTSQRVALPVAALVWISTQPFLAGPSTAAFERADLDAYRGLVADEYDDGTACGNSIVFAGAAGILATAIAVVVGWTALRARSRMRHALDALAFLPLAVPGLVLGVALLQVFLRAPVLLYGTAPPSCSGSWPATSRMRRDSRVPGFAPLGRELEDVARVAASAGGRPFDGSRAAERGRGLCGVARRVHGRAHGRLAGARSHAPGTEVVGVRSGRCTRAAAGMSSPRWAS